MITNISFQHVKGHSRSISLTPVVAIVGANAAGKSSVLDALDWAMYSYSPRLRSPSAKGVPNADMFKLASSHFMSVRLETDTGVNVRRLDKKGEKLVKTEDAPVEFNPILRDSNLYFALSPDARVKLVASMVRREDAKGFSITEMLAAVKNVRLETNSEASEKAVLACYNALASVGDALPPLDWLASAISATTNTLKLAKQTRQRMTSCGVAISQLQASDADQATVSATAETRLQAARKQLGELQEQSGRLQSALEAAQRTELRRGKLAAVPKPDADVAKLTGDRDVLKQQGLKAQQDALARKRSTAQLWGEVTRLQSELAALQREFVRTAARRKELEAVKQPGVDATALNENQSLLSAQVADLEKAVSARERSTEQLAADISGMEALRKVQADNYRAAKSDIAALEERIRQFTAHDKCPTCHAAGSEWKAMWIAEQQAALAALHKKLDVATEAGCSIKRQIAAVQTKLDAQRKQDTALAQSKQQHAAIAATLAKNAQALSDYRNAQQEIERLNHGAATSDQSRVTLEAMLKAAVATHAQAKAQDDALATLLQQHAAAEAALVAAVEAGRSYADAQKELAQLGEPADGAAQLACDTNAADIRAKQQDIAVLEQQQKQVALARADLKRQMESVAAAESAQAECDVLKAVKEILEAKQAALVAVAFTSLLQVTNRFTSALIPYPVEYVDGSVGYRDPKHGVFVHTDTFNASWELVLYTGLCVALAAASEQRVVIIDEMSRLDAKNKRALVLRLAELVQEGVIHQAILVDLDGSIYSDIAKSNAAVSVIAV